MGPYDDYLPLAFRRLGGLFGAPQPAGAPISAPMAVPPPRLGMPQSAPGAPQWTSPEAIKAMEEQAKRGADFPIISGQGVAGGAVNLLGPRGVLSTLPISLAQMKAQDNERMRNAAFDSVRGSKDLAATTDALLRSGVPGLAEEGLKARIAIQQAEADRAARSNEAQQFLSPFAGQQPASAAAQPSPSAMPQTAEASPPTTPASPWAATVTPEQGASVAPAPTQAPAPTAATAQPPQPTPQEITNSPQFWRPDAPSPVDPRRLALARGVIGKVLPQEATHLLQPELEAQKAQDAKMGGHYADQLNGLLSSVPKLAQQRGELDLLKHMAAHPELVSQGWGTGLGMRFKSIAEAAGFKTDLDMTQVFQALMSKLALEGRSTADGAGMPGSMSDKDLEFLQAMTGGIQNTPEANQALLSIRQRMVDRQIQVAKLATNYAANNNGRFDIGFHTRLQKWAAANPLFTEKDAYALFGRTAPPEQSAAPGPAAQAQPPGEQTPAAPSGGQFATPAFKDAGEAMTAFSSAPVGHTMTAPEGFKIRGQDLSGATIVKGPDGQWRPTSFTEDVGRGLGYVGGALTSGAKNISKWMHQGQDLPAKGARQLFQGGMSWPRG